MLSYLEMNTMCDNLCALMLQNLFLHTEYATTLCNHEIILPPQVLLQISRAAQHHNPDPEPQHGSRVHRLHSRGSAYLQT